MHLLERTGVLQDLLRRAARARAGDGGVVLLRGEAGIGKTSVATVLATALAGDARVLWGACDDLLAPRPLGPFWDMAAKEPALGPVLAGDDPAAVRQAVLEITLRSSRPTVLVVEDVHWADGATLDLLTLAGRRVAGSPGRRVAGSRTLIVLTLREVPSEHPLNRVLGSLRQADVHSTTLSPLSRESVDALAGSADEGGRVFALTGGNPFFTSAVLSAGGGVPETVRDVVNGLLSQVDGPTRDLVEVVSVCPGHATAALLDAVDPDLRALLDGVAHLALLRGDGEVVAFRHELARTAVEEGLAPGRRRELHGRVLAAAEGLGLDPARRPPYRPRAVPRPAPHRRAGGSSRALVRRGRDRRGSGARPRPARRRAAPDVRGRRRHRGRPRAGVHGGVDDG